MSSFTLQIRKEIYHAELMNKNKVSLAKIYSMSLVWKLGAIGVQVLSVNMRSCTPRAVVLSGHCRQGMNEIVRAALVAPASSNAYMAELVIQR